jgi:hypothetical protein
VECWIQWISGEFKVECLSTLACSKGIVTVGFESTRVVDLVIADLGILRVEGGEDRDLEVLSYEIPIRKIPS